MIGCPCRGLEIRVTQYNGKLCNPLHRREMHCRPFCSRLLSFIEVPRGRAKLRLIGQLYDLLQISVCASNYTRFYIAVGSFLRGCSNLAEQARRSSWDLTTLSITSVSTVLRSRRARHFHCSLYGKRPLERFSLVQTSRTADLPLKFRRKHVERRRDGHSKGNLCRRMCVSFLR